MTLITVPLAAAELGVCVQRVRVLCRQGRVQGAQKVGRDWLIPIPIVVMPGSKQCPGKIKLHDALPANG
jgi:hypothetical protein